MITDIPLAKQDVCVQQLKLVALHLQTWDNRRDCFYIGNQNGGTVFELPTAHDSFIEGDFREYQTSGQFDTNFKYSHFNEENCAS